MTPQQAEQKLYPKFLRLQKRIWILNKASCGVKYKEYIIPN